MALPGPALLNLARPTPETVARAASGALFLERARLVQPDFALTQEDARALAELLRRLDGMPLVIKIAAVLRLIAEGLPNKQIATALAIAERTVKTHLTSAMNKLGVDNRAHAVVVAIQRGLV